MRWMRIVVESVTELRRVLLHPGAEAPARRIHITVSDWRPPRPGWSGRLGPLPGVRSHTVRLPRRGRGKAQVRIVLAEPASLRVVLSAAVPALWPGPPPIGSMPAGPSAALQETRSAGTAADHGGSMADEGGGGEVVAGSETAAGFDLGVINPIGRAAGYGPSCPQAGLELADGRWRVVARDDDRPRVLIGWRTFPELDDEAQAVARELNVLHGDYVPVEEPELAARLVVLFAAMGVVCHWPTLPATAAELLGAELWGMVSSPLPEQTAGPAAWESLSVAQRRAAIRGHAREFVADAGHPGLRSLPLRRPPVSALLVIPDPEALSAKSDASLEPGSLPSVLRQVQDQTYGPLELVVGVRGEAAATTIRRGLPASTPVAVQVHAFPSASSRAELLAAAADRARGSLVTIFDTGHDYGIEHVWDLVLARAYSGADLVGKPAEFTHLKPLDLTVRHSRGPAERYTDRVAGGAMLVGRADLHGDRTGRRWYPLDSELPGRILRDGGLVYVTHGLDFLVRRNASATPYRASPGAETRAR